tara:strand:- start:95 stop:895 length:801 start_codon:yes stop_codon:yes gene_type:complete
MAILNSFFNSKLFDNLHKFLAKKIFKFTKYFFVETKFKNLPILNYPLNEKHFDFPGENSALTNDKPYLSYSHLPDLLSIIYKENNKISFLDYGAANLNLYYYLDKKFENFKYYFVDQEIIKEKVDEIIQEKKFNNIFLKEIEHINEKLDMVYFGSSLQYLENYKNCLIKCCKKTRYILISQLPVFFNSNLSDTIVMKQLNMHPEINYLYLFNFEPLVTFLNKNNYNLVEKNINKVTKFLNFKNFDKNKYKDINMYDLLFEYKHEKK